MIRLKYRISTLLLAFALPAAPAIAATTVSSSSYGLGANLTVGNLVVANVGPIGAASGTASPAYDQSATVLSVNQNLALASIAGIAFREQLSTGILVSTARSAFPASITGDASATINNLSTALTAKAPIVPVLTLLGLSATTIRSTAAVDGSAGLSAVGSTTIEGLNLTGLGLGGLLIDGSLFINPNPNTVLVDLLGLRIVLNEQILSGDGVTDLMLQTNALRASFTNFALGTNLLNGDVVIGHSQAAINDFALPTAPVPEPATWAMMIAGFGMAGGAMRRRRPRTVLA